MFWFAVRLQRVITLEEVEGGRGSGRAGRVLEEEEVLGARGGDGSARVGLSLLAEGKRVCERVVVEAIMGYVEYEFRISSVSKNSLPLQRSVFDNRPDLSKGLRTLLVFNSSVLITHGVGNIMPKARCVKVVVVGGGEGGGVGGLVAMYWRSRCEMHVLTESCAHLPQALYPHF